MAHSSGQKKKLIGCLPLWNDPFEALNLSQILAPYVDMLAAEPGEVKQNKIREYLVRTDG